MLSLPGFRVNCRDFKLSSNTPVKYSHRLMNFSDWVFFSLKRRQRKNINKLLCTNVFVYVF